MSLDRRQLLEEMGLGPQWVLRTAPVAACSAPSQSTGFSPAEAATPSAEGTEPAPAPAASRAPAGPERAAQIAALDWPQLPDAIAACRACGLCEQRKQTVPGVGDAEADWLFIGEGPGAEEDARGEPFVGQAGKLLDAMLAAVDLNRSRGVYIANAVKCRPPGNRTPEAAELAACKPWLERQIELIQPKLIVLLGKVAVHAVLGEDGSLASLRGKAMSYRCGDRTIPVVVTYHPAYLLRSLPDKAKSWEDLCRARSLMQGLTGADATPSA